MRSLTLTGYFIGQARYRSIALEAYRGKLGGMLIRRSNPATGEVLRTFETLDARAVAMRIARSAEAFQELRRMSMQHRALCMGKLAALLEEERSDLARTITMEMGKTLRSAEAEILKCAGCCRYYAEQAARILAPAPIPGGTGQSYVQYEPLGPVLAVMPWNFPFWQVLRFAIPTLMAGNPVLLKPALQVPGCALRVEELVHRAGFPRGALTVLLIAEEQVEDVLADDRVRAVTVTGSEDAGRALAAQAGWLLKRSVLELGGSDAFIVMPSADLEAAIAAATESRMVNCGQSCIAAKRFIVHESVFTTFLHRFAGAMEALQVGDPLRPETEVGPLVSAEALTRLEGQVNAALQAGARLITGGARMVGRGNYFEPTVLADLPRSAPVYREEMFGPVALVFRAQHLEEAIAIANDTPFGLGASVWTRDPAEQRELIAEIETGMVFLNAVVASDPRLPFGGTKRSGYGRALGYAGAREFTNAKTVVVA